MGLTATNSDFVYENKETRCQREAKDEVMHSVAMNARVKGRTAAASSVRRVAAMDGDAATAATSTRSRSATSAVGKSEMKDKSATAASSARSSRSSSPKSKRQKRRASANRKPANLTRCYEQPERLKRERCVKKANWQHGKYVRDECGSGVMPQRTYFLASRKGAWCKTPLSMYQATIGELGRKILCHERIVPRDVKPGPPCTVCDDILPPCRGYYRKYECLRPCEEEYAVKRPGGQKTYRREFARYWEPCLMKAEEGHRLDINEFAGQNVFLASQLRRENYEVPCW